MFQVLLRRLTFGSLANGGDQGRKFDAQGNPKDWWTVQDAKAYEQSGKCISDEYTEEISGVDAQPAQRWVSGVNQVHDLLF